MPRMGDLAATDVYNAFDVPPEQTYDRRLDQTWPGRLVQDAMGAVLAPGRALQSTEPITTEQMIKPAMDLAGLVTGGSYAAPAQRGASGAGIRAYHSSPHDKPTFVNRGGGMFDARVGDQFAGTAMIAGDGTKPFLSSVSVEPQFRGQGVGRGLYEQAEASLGRPLVPSPLGLSEDATRLWQKRLAAMEPKEARALVDEARQLGASYGLKPDQIAARLDALIAERQGIRAYHSSPHDFDKFDLARIGTGEGAQVYGHGLYFAESPAVSGQGGQYWQQFKNKFSGPELAAADALHGSKFDREAAADLINKAIKRQTDIGANPEAGFIQDRLRALELLKSNKPVGPRTYEVNINADPARFLDWDKPLREQPKAVQAIADDVLRNPSRGTAGFLDDAYNPRFPASGGNLYEAMARRRPNPAYDPVKDPLGSPTIISHAGASDVLREAGIPGIKYLDQGSRNYSDIAPFIAQHGGSDKALAYARGRHAETSKQYGEGSVDARDWAKTIQEILNPPTSNYVVFDPGIIDIMKKYGLAGAAPVGMGALAAQDRYE